MRAIPWAAKRAASPGPARAAHFCGISSAAAALQNRALENLGAAVLPRLYRDVNLHKPQAYWDYEALSVNWGCQDRIHTYIYIYIYVYNSLMTVSNFRTCISFNMFCIFQIHIYIYIYIVLNP